MDNKLISFENNSNKTVIEFKCHEDLEINTKEVYKCVLTGTLTERHVMNRCNIVLSKGERFNSINGNLEAVDIKDSRFVDSCFKNTKFDNSSFINSFFTNVRFDNCTFYFVSITGTYFKSVVFENCNLDNMVIESCKFFDCTFINCHTSNKLIEQSLLLNSIFSNTEIELETIINNFGLSYEQLDNCKIRKISISPNYNYISAVDLANLLKEDHFSNVECFKIEYFLNNNVFSDGSSLIDSIFEVNSWISTSEIPITFINNLNLFYEFLYYNYEYNKIPIWPLLRYHYLTGLLSTLMYQNALYPSIMGIHMALSRYMESFYYLVGKHVKLQRNPLVLLVESGSLDKSYYEQLLLPLFINSRAKIINVVKHNSPNELFIQWFDVVRDLTPIIALFLATRLKVEIINKGLKGSVTNSPQPLLISDNSNNDIENIDSESEQDPNIKMKVAFPNEENNLHVELNLNHKSSVICKVGKTIIEILT